MKTENTNKDLTEKKNIKKLFKNNEKNIIDAIKILQDYTQDEWRGSLRVTTQNSFDLSCAIIGELRKKFRKLEVLHFFERNPFKKIYYFIVKYKIKNREQKLFGQVATLKGALVMLEKGEYLPNPKR